MRGVPHQRCRSAAGSGIADQGHPPQALPRHLPAGAPGGEAREEMERSSEVVEVESEEAESEEAEAALVAAAAAANRVTDPSLVEHISATEDPNSMAKVLMEARRVNEALLCVGWTFPAGHSTSQGQADYLDGSCLIYAEDQLLDVVDFRGAHSAVLRCPSQRASSASLEWSAGRGKEASVLHSGDVMCRDGGSHVIRVRLAELPVHATDCFFVISAYNCRNLSLFNSLSMRLLDAECPSQPLLKFTIADAGHASAVVVCALTRRRGEWIVRGFSHPCDATVRDYTPIEAAIAPVQEHHCRWRRRRPLVLLNELCMAGRALPKEEVPKEDILFRLLRLHLHLFQYIMEFI